MKYKFHTLKSVTFHLHTLKRVLLYICFNVTSKRFCINTSITSMKVNIHFIDWLSKPYKNIIMKYTHIESYSIRISVLNRHDRNGLPQAKAKSVVKALFPPNHEVLDFPVFLPNLKKAPTLHEEPSNLKR